VTFDDRGIVGVYGCVDVITDDRSIAVAVGREELLVVRLRFIIG